MKKKSFKYFEQYKTKQLNKLELTNIFFFEVKDMFNAFFNFFLSTSHGDDIFIFWKSDVDLNMYLKKLFS